MRIFAGIALAFAASGAFASGFQPSDDDLRVQQGRQLLAREFPEVMRHMARQDGFGGPSSKPIARAMLSDAPDLVAEAKAKMTVEKIEDGVWLIHFPYVNVALIETRHGLVLFDTGYAAIGPVLVELIPTLSKNPLSHIIVSHTHVDHAYGWPALKAKWPMAKMITSALLPEMAARDVRLGGSIGRLNNQPLHLQPASIDQMPTPDIVFEDKLSIQIDGERFELYHAPAETEEQIWMAAPDRRAIFTADYYQGFLPNAGNGKRIMRHVDEWAAALRDMSAKKPTVLLPMHGAAIVDESEVQSRLTILAEALEFVSEETVRRLNAGERKDAIAATFSWPERFANEPSLNPEYNRPEDISRMVAMRWTGWWDDVPGHFAALAFEEEAKEAVRLAGGIDALDKRARELLVSNPKMAARLADWAFFGAPGDPKALRLTIDVYMSRLAEPDMPVQEGLVYFDQAARARAQLEALKAAP
ncbi:MBL fold metallo-hydrolase [Sphingorhabdus sp.]|jgi:glyoxylase-like metal-dependent hydrolase (beta-lactamase superfamily II)|uniref:MBL fold metallo-hydrolase n=3 Tax=Sphingorhabdus sp. TaxID=1902408 RepID=UPI003BAE5143|nr:MBL fold metallo-hydrolase [Sphingomonadales bacterium]